MRRPRLTGRLRGGQLALLVVMVAVTACGRAASTTGPAAPPNASATLSSSTPTSVPVSQPPVPARTPPAPTPTPPTGAAQSKAASTPVRLQIPAIGVDSDLMDLGLETDGTLQVPPTGFPAGWYTGAPTPGELGPAIIAGHVDWSGRPGVFFDLRDLTSGDEITVIRQDGSTARFHVERVERFAKDQFPTEQVYADLDHAGLRLITCGGEFDRQARSYEDNLVIFARLVDSDPGP